MSVALFISRHVNAERQWKGRLSIVQTIGLDMHRLYTSHYRYIQTLPAMNQMTIKRVIKLSKEDSLVDSRVASSSAVK